MLACNIRPFQVGLSVGNLALGRFFLRMVGGSSEGKMVSESNWEE